MAFAAGLGFVNGRAETELARFRDYWVAKAGPGAAKLDWSATWRNWLRRSAQDSQARQRPAGAAGDDPFAGAH